VAQLDHALECGPITLRRFRAADLDDLAAMYADESVSRYLYWNVRSREETRVMLEEKMLRAVDVGRDNILPVAVAWSETDRLIGDFMLRWREDEHRQGEIGGSVSAPYRGRGVAAATYGELLNLGFATYRLHRIFGRCDGRNQASIRSLERAGLTREAHFVENEFVKGEWTDEVVLAIRRSVWEGRHPG
jgi:RimJ/RimL family protein N-acetyltransferase